jgi:hypothetical protein
MTADIVVELDGPLATVALLNGATPAGADWLDTHVEPDAQRWAGRVVCEHRYVAAIVAGARAAGLNVETEATATGGPGWPGPCPDGMTWERWLANNNVD